MSRAFQIFRDPPREFGPIPFWFWNDDLDEAELLRQVRAFHAAGFGGVLPHARVGLSRRVGYLTEEYFRLLRVVVEECARLGMKVILYDEASYPSGSARGGVVAQDPGFASQAIGLWEKEIEGPWRGYWRPNTGRALLDRHVCTVLGRVDAQGRIEAATVRRLEPLPRTIFHIDVPAGSWKVMSVWNTHSGGHIRGAFPEEESGHATAPPAADILNPEAVACFLRLTHDRYHAHLGEFFGDPIIALFTDEPGVFGKGPQRPRDPRPFTPGFVAWLAELWGRDPRPWLPALWLDYGPGTAAFRRDYAAAVQTRLHRVFYAAQSEWCARHGIALTGHPAGSDEMSCLRYFQLPGQDMVWRYVEPGKPGALEGPHSVAPKAATSAARIHRRRRILTEVCGAYGWRLTLDEVKWLFDWHLVRGNNLVNPHAVFYSIRDRRAWESEPDLGIHNVFWPYLPLLTAYVRRLSWLLCDGEQVCQVAVLGDGDALPWQAARQLYRGQIDFLYVDGSAVAEGRMVDGRLTIGTQAYRAVVVDGDPSLDAPARSRLAALAAAGGLVLRFEAGMDLPSRLDEALPRDLRLDPPHTDLRCLHYRRDGLDCYLLVNEGEGVIEGEAKVPVRGAVEVWDAWRGRTLPVAAAAQADGLRVALRLERRESLVLAVDPARAFRAPPPPEAWSEVVTDLDPVWQVTDDQGQPAAVPAPGDWSRHPGWELFAGTLVYRADIDLPPADEVWIDLGRVGDIAEVRLDDGVAGVRLWAPYRVPLGAALAAGRHRLEVRVTNTMANAMEGLQAPSGLMGPVRLTCRARCAR